MDYLREHIDQIVSECDIEFLQWLCDSLPDCEDEIKCAIMEAI